MHIPHCWKSHAAANILFKLDHWKWKIDIDGIYLFRPKEMLANSVDQDKMSFMFHVFREYLRQEELRLLEEKQKLEADEIERREKEKLRLVEVSL